MELLKLICPGCQEGFLFQQIQKHMEQCEGVKIIAKEGRKKETQMTTEDMVFNMQQASLNKRVTQT